MEKTDLRVVKTLRQIDQALLENLASHPFSKITVEMLCKTAMINRSTFYKYYLDKYDLLNQYIGRTLGEFKERIQVEFINAEPATVGDSSYVRSYSAALRFIESKKREYELLWSAGIDRQLFQEMTQIVRDNILATLPPMAGDTPEKRQYADLYAALFASNMMSLVQWWFRYYDTVTRQEMEEIMTDNMYQGMFKTFKRRMKEM